VYRTRNLIFVVVLALFLIGCPAGDDDSMSDNEKTHPTVTWPEGLTAIYGSSLVNIPLAAYANNGGISGVFSWTTRSDSVGDLGAQSHNMTFTPDDAANHHTVTQDVTIIVRLVEMVRVEAGSFEMGKNLGTVGSDSTPVHNVTLTKDFYMGVYEVTQAQYQTVIGTNPSAFSSSSVVIIGINNNLPVENVCWYEALIFCNKLSVLEGFNPVYSISDSADPADWGTVPTNATNATWNAAIMDTTANGYRLPTEAEWEYAAKGGNTGEQFSYAGSDDPEEVAWQSTNSPIVASFRTHMVGTLAPNGLGIYDMCGNVQEWCWDLYNMYTSETQTDPLGPTSALTPNNRVIRGGSYNSSGGIIVSSRSPRAPQTKNANGGFRLVRAAE